MSKQKDNINNLLAAIKRQSTGSSARKAPEDYSMEAQPNADVPAKSVPAKVAAPERKARSRVGKPVQFWMHDEDRKLVRELSAWLAGQGIRPTDSMVIRAVLRQAKTGGALVEAYWEAAKLDGRQKRE